MTGNRNFKHHSCGVFLIFAGLYLQSVKADNLTFGDQSRLSGTVSSMSSSGVIALTSDLSPEPLLFKSGAVKKLDFGASSEEVSSGNALLELLNGDLLQASIESLDDENLKVMTAEAGLLSIPRAGLRSLSLGIQTRKPIYSGPRKNGEWINGAGASPGWVFANNSLIATGPASASASFKLPNRFVLKFTLKWQGIPSYKIYFADPLKTDGNPVDRYYMQFGSAGVEVKRESSSGKSFQTIILLPLESSEFPDNQVDVELRVDRKAARIHLLLDGEEEGVGVDPNHQAPVGQGVTVTNESQNGANHEIRGIEILEFENTRARHLKENRGDESLDSLISREDDRWSGRLTQIKKGLEGMSFSFKNDFQDAPLELADSDVATVFFAEQKQAGATPDSPPAFVLKLRSGGNLQITSCEFADETISASHPLLGSLKIKRDGVLSIEPAPANPVPEATKNPVE